MQANPPKDFANAASANLITDSERVARPESSKGVVDAPGGHKPRRGSGSRWVRLGLSTVGIVFVWLVLLPCVGRFPAVQCHLEHLEARNINASAMFYTELEDRP
jgi:hypothetical protein